MHNQKNRPKLNVDFLKTAVEPMTDEQRGNDDWGPPLAYEETARIRHYRVQYRMMDDVGLISADNMAWLTRGLTAAERPVAERVLSLAVKCRNAVAHGAVFKYTEELRRVYGHLVIKAIQLVIDAGLQELQARHA